MIDPKFTAAAGCPDLSGVFQTTVTWPNPLPAGRNHSMKDEGQPIETAPKDRAILAWCDHEEDPYVEDEKTGRLTLYGAHAEGLSHASTGFHVVVWGGSWDDRTYEDPNAGWLPDWWFVENSEFEVAANPVLWWELPIKPEGK